jgi:NAD(P)-dependent dehydrogenase (short-subunit alcohol dehydrogenase family)
VKKILLTGYKGGIGSKVVELLSQEYTFINLIRESDHYEDNNNLHFYNVNFESWSDIEGTIHKIIDKHGQINGIIHAAGNDFLAPLSFTNEKKVKDLFSIHVFFTIALISLALKKKLLSTNSSVVLFSSLAAHKPSPGHSIYASAKGALEGFLPTASNELIKKGIRMNMIVPGIVKTKMSENYLSKMTSEQIQNLSNSYPLGFIEPIDIVNMISFLISEKSSKVTGQKFIIDGGNSIYF